LPEEIDVLVGCWTGLGASPGWYAKPQPCDFFDLKGALESLLERLKVPGAQFDRLADGESPYLQKGVSASVSGNGNALGVMGEIHPKVLDAYDLKQTVFVFEIPMPMLARAIPEAIEAQPLPRFPSTSRDATLIVDRTIESGRILDHILTMREPLVEDVQLFDLFEGRPIPEGKKSISLRVTYRSPETTLEDEAVNELHKQISDRLVSRFNADLPA
jgi:phenylalanyl-tRNA synthetase beta chain